MNGILCIDKPGGFTSFDVIAKFRGMAGTRKIGHSGTLDPMATGVLPLFIGGATKACDLVPNHDKRYRAAFRLGVVTDTQDSTGEVLSRREARVAPEQVEQALLGFQGDILQVPPMYSAVKVGGKRLYDLARQGVEVERRPRPVTVYGIRLLEARGEEYEMEVHCSRGTYIRTLCHDLGQKLGCGAVLTGLRRTMACGYTLESCVTLEEAQRLADEGKLAERVLPVETAFAALPRLVLEGRMAFHFQSGVRLALERLELPEGEEPLAVFDEGGGFLGIAAADREAGVLRAKRVFSR